jgi:hypothetical protein
LERRCQPTRLDPIKEGDPGLCRERLGKLVGLGKKI